MFVKEIETPDPNVRLVKPEVERDAQLGVDWLKGANGRQLLKLMGVATKDNKESTLEDEIARIRGFLMKKDQINWMISLEGKIIGSVWADLDATEYIGAPAVSIMLGDPESRGQGIGKVAAGSVVNFLTASDYPRVYGRYLVDNKASRAMLTGLRFVLDGLPYSDEDGLEWQNVFYSKGLAGIGRFLDGDKRLNAWPSKTADKLAALEYLATKFEFQRKYSEHQVNELLKKWHNFHDWPLLRRELFEKGFVTRKRDGSEYQRTLQ
jgi:RimJ/RimL family protein N-acetyltransferase